MKKVKITVMRRTEYPDLMEKYENPLETPCEMIIGQEFVSVDRKKPEGLCDTAWSCMEPYVMTLAHGGSDFYNGWMKNPYSAMVSCNDGFRPVTYLLEVLDEV